MSLPTTADRSLPRIEVPITLGNVRNGHVYVRDFLWFFPKSAIRGNRLDRSEARPCTLELADFGIVQSEIDAAKGIFRWRGWKRFFRQHSVGEGDCLVFSRIGRNRFSVTVKHVALEGLAAAGSTPASDKRQSRTPATQRRRCNDLSGDEWLRCSLSVWSDIRKSVEEAQLDHPAMFPTMLCERLISMFLRRRGQHKVLDPFVGSGSTLLAARNLGKVGIGLEVNESYVKLARRRLEDRSLFDSNAPAYELHCADARQLLQHVRPGSIHLCITSPPYWNILRQKRTADYKQIRHYGDLKRDLGTIGDYEAFCTELELIFASVLRALRGGAYCIVVVMDLRKKNQFYPFHSDLAARMVNLGFAFEDIIIWDRRQEYSNLRPLGYPSVFRINKIHEYILIFRKPRTLG